MSHPHQDASNDTTNVGQDSALVAFHTTTDMGGLVAASPSHHGHLFTLLDSREKNVYYVFDPAVNVEDASSPMLILAVKEKHPDVDPGCLLLLRLQAVPDVKSIREAQAFLGHKVNLPRNQVVYELLPSLYRARKEITVCILHNRFIILIIFPCSSCRQFHSELTGHNCELQAFHLAFLHTLQGT